MEICIKISLVNKILDVYIPGIFRETQFSLKQHPTLFSLSEFAAFEKYSLDCIYFPQSSCVTPENRQAPPTERKTISSFLHSVSLLSLCGAFTSRSAATMKIE